MKSLKLLLLSISFVLLSCTESELIENNGSVEKDINTEKSCCGEEEDIIPPPPPKKGDS
ncbi:hypothetical protein SAMN04489761_4353 [Tenacibaculum sp. MAR_2009_124]|uniref:hypothetical protein n=1 Tax=Tenacibaculum sp. MAR_2009_124 TaxID=1250059 RepID=UPI00089CB38F|nr:hypothetical protein [Tenacibaculum sp. MAR_2009_124]SED12600.1 hypothetical protein SAMN04489761_4353 [Tenacibaculum sp. MAR_2009_124]